MAENGVVGQISTQADQTQTPPAVPAPAANEERPSRALPTDRLSFPKQMEVLRAYAIASGQNGKVVANAELANLTKLNISSASYNNTFFAEIGLITKVGNGYVPATEVVSFNRQHGYDATTAAHKLAPALRRAWFGEVLMQRLEMRPIPEKEAVAELADAASAGPRYAGQLRTLLDFLETAGLIEREGGMIRKGAANRAVEESPRIEPQTPAPESVSRREPAPAGAVVTSFANVPAGAVSFNVDVTVDMKEMATWKPEVVAAFFAGIAQVISAKAMVERAAGTR